MAGERAAGALHESGSTSSCPPGRRVPLATGAGPLARCGPESSSWRRMLGPGLVSDAHAPLVDLVVEERAHQALVSAVAQGLSFATNCSDVLHRVGRPLLGEPAP